MGWIQFVDDNPDTVLAESIAKYEAIAGRKLGPSDPEMLSISAFAAQLAQHRTMLNIVGNQNFINNASGEALDEVVAKMNTYRLDASPAKVSIVFVPVDGAPTFTLPAGMRMRSDDGKVIFALDNDILFEEGAPAAGGNCTATVPGTIGNGYAAGRVNTIIDPQPYLASVYNADTTNGGSDTETDDALRERAKLSPASFSVAGPEDAYIYWAKTANSAIVDVQSITTAPGTVTVYPLLRDGVLPDTAVCDAVLEVLSAKKVRPQNDTVLVVAPTAIEYAIDATYRIKRNVNDSTTQALLLAALSVLQDYNNKPLGKDRTLDQLKGLAMAVPGMYTIDFGDFEDIQCAPNEFAKCTGITLALDEIVDED